MRSTGLAFPAFSGVEKIPHVGLHFDGTGYPLRTRDALYSTLTNPAYIGWYMFKGVVVSKEAHDPIVKMDDFLYAYNKLSNVKLDGEPNENKPIKTRQRKGTVKALLEGILESNGDPVYLIARHKAYIVTSHTDNGQRAELAVNVDLLDYGI